MIKEPKILIIRLGRIGDMILSTPVFFHIKEHMPGSKIHVLASGVNQSVIKYSSYIDNSYILDKNPTKLFKLIAKLRKEKYDIVLEPKDHHSTESAIISSLIPASQKIGFIKSKFSPFDIDIREVLDEDKKHFLERLLCSVKVFGIKPDFSSKPKLAFSAKEEERFNLLVKAEKYVLYNPSASRESKKIDEETSLALLKYLKEADFKAYLMTSPEDFDTNLKLSQDTGIELLNTKSILETFPIIKNASLIITADTSLVHIASAYNTDMIGLYKDNPTEYEKFKPRMDKFKIFHSNSEGPLKYDTMKIIVQIEKMLNI